ncbi:MAG: hypothetical protein GEU76_16355 [Alphaproteobacteria bacterium]|nr:hypothetical protein [Alphaproteobacteria bacterium]
MDTLSTPAIGEPPPRNKWAQRLARHLLRNELDKVGDLITAAASAKDLTGLARFLRRTGTQDEQLERFLRLLLSDNAVTFSHLGLIAVALELGAALGRQGLVMKRVSRLIEADSRPIVHWGFSDRLWRFMPLGRQAAEQLAVLKYGGIPAFDSDNLLDLDSAELLALAEKHVERLLLPQALLDNLYRHSRCQELQRADWERHVKTAYWIDHITDDLQRFFRKGAKRNYTCVDLIEVEAKRDALGQIDASKGTVLMSFHGAFLTMTRAFYAAAFEKGLIVQKNSSVIPGRIGVRDNHRAALFAAFRALQERKVLLLTPDGGQGEKSSTLNVLGVPVRVGVGAAFLAYEAKCNTAWYTVARQGDRFVPIIVPGPSRTAGETYDEFQTRLLSFVAERIESILTGDPRSIALGLKWSAALGRSLTAAGAPP